MFRHLIALYLAFISTAAMANNWEKFFTPIPGNEFLTRSSNEPVLTQTSGDVERDLSEMYRKGFGLIGYSEFNSPNAKTRDAVRFAKKLGATHVIIITQLESSQTRTVPMPVPTNTTSNTTGTANVYGNGGLVSGTFAGTTTTSGISTAYVPVTVNRFNKGAAYFGVVPQIGTGAMIRDLTENEARSVDTRRAVAIRWIRDGSPAYLADLFPGDIVISINGKPADISTWQTELKNAEKLDLTFVRSGQTRSAQLEIPESWQVK